MEYIIVEDDYLSEPRLNLISPLTMDVIDFINAKNYRSILLNQRLGWKSQELGILTKVKNLKCLYLMDDEIKDLAMIEDLQDLEYLQLECLGVKQGFNFVKLTNLKVVKIDWRPCFESLHQVGWLLQLRIDKYKNKDLSKFKTSPNLNRFELVQATIESTNGIKQFVRLKNLMLYRCSKLKDISELALTALSELRLETCKKVENLEAVFCIKSIETLILDKCHSLNSIKGISNLPLRKVRISDTVIVDGDLSEILSLTNCDIYFDNKKHYSHKYVWINDYSEKAIIPA